MCVCVWLLCCIVMIVLGDKYDRSLIEGDPPAGSAFHQRLAEANLPCKSFKPGPPVKHTAPLPYKATR